MQEHSYQPFLSVQKKKSLKSNLISQVNSSPLIRKIYNGAGHSVTMVMYHVRLNVTNKMDVFFFVDFACITENYMQLSSKASGLIFFDNQNTRKPR